MDIWSAEDPLYPGTPGPITRMPPGFAVMFGVYGQTELTGPDIPDSTGPGTIAGLFSLDEPELMFDPGIQAAAMYVASHLHEAIEWIQVDGKPIAQAHPSRRKESEMWKWLQQKMYELVDEYCQRWPLEGS